MVRERVGRGFSVGKIRSDSCFPQRIRGGVEEGSADVLVASKRVQREAVAAARVGSSECPPPKPIGPMKLT